MFGKKTKNLNQINSKPETQPNKSKQPSKITRRRTFASFQGKSARVLSKLHQCCSVDRRIRYLELLHVSLTFQTILPIFPPGPQRLSTSPKSDPLQGGLRIAHQSSSLTDACMSGLTGNLCPTFPTDRGSFTGIQGS